jgi:lysophospholipase L1-like esterase
MFLVIVAVAAGSGFWIGRDRALHDFEVGIESFGAQESLGRVVALNAGSGPDEPQISRERYALAYHDPARAVADMDTYAWAVRSVPTPFVGYAPAPGAHGNAFINSQQLRHDEDLAVPKPADRTRVFLTGGSVAFGSGAPSQDRTITGYLQAAVDPERSGVEVVNAASPGWTSTQERIWITNRLSGLDPDLVVSFSGVNDVHWAARGRNVLFFRAYDDQFYWSLLQMLYTRLGRSFPDVVPVLGGALPPRLVAARLLENLQFTARALAPQGVPFVFVLQPNIATTGKSLSPREQLLKESNQHGPRYNRYFQQSYAVIRAALARASRPLEVIDLSGVFDASPADEEIFLDSYHFGDRGNERIARALADALGPRLAQGRSALGRR